MTETVVIVEGRSDQVALETLAARQGRDLRVAGVSIAPIGGAQAIARFLREAQSAGSTVRLAGLCDRNEEAAFRRALAAAGMGAALTRADLEGLGFFVCDVDLEDELIRALGVPAVEKVIATQHQLRGFRLAQRQPAQQGWTAERQLRRFISSHSGHKAKYARLLVEALDLARVPRPLARLLDYLFASPG